MKFSQIIYYTALFSLLIFSACSNSGRMMGGKTKGLRYSPPGEWSGQPDETQVPGEIVKGASSRHGGAFNTGDTVAEPFVPSNEDFGDDEDEKVEANQPASSQVSAPAAVEAIPKHRSSELALVIGPIVLEEQNSGEKVESDAGRTVREIIAKHISELKSVRVLDAPEERNIDDAPRPDLAKKGVRFVVKGTASTRGSSNEMQVFLRVVETTTGKINMIVSGQDKDLNTAATQASERLAKKLEGVSA